MVALGVSNSTTLRPEYQAELRVTNLNIGYSVPIPLELRFHRNKLAFDDYLMIVATVREVYFTRVKADHKPQLGPPNVEGRHIETVTHEDLESFWRIRTRDPRHSADFLFGHFYMFAIVSMKVSVLALYHRAFPSVMLQRFIIATGTAIVLWLVITEFLLGFICQPAKSCWRLDIEGKCLNLVSLSYSIVTMNLLTDLWIFILPLPVIFRMRISRTKKILLCGPFVVGILICAISATRLSFVLGLDRKSPDFTWDGYPLSILAVWEPLGGIVCANLPVTYKPLATGICRVMRIVFPGRAGQKANGNVASWYRHHIDRVTLEGYCAMGVWTTGVLG
ncbi:hypothetical protein BJX76DRAFT_347454 [Aspergillus varians]